ncbi:MAG TPA: DinB family protein [Polyangia bacterium]|nr:DinB family protein [Polyangia bacterium]
MFTGTYALLMAEYNRWMNEKVYAAAATLTDEERKRDRGAFFKSIHATLNHLLTVDGSWLGRFNGKSYPGAPLGESLHHDFAALRAARAAMDGEILSWARAVSPEALAEPMTWTAKLYGFTQTHPRWVQVVQMFNHQTHHRGQVHAMLTAAGLDVGPTDLPMMPVLKGG